MQYLLKRLPLALPALVVLLAMAWLLSAATPSFAHSAFSLTPTAEPTEPPTNTPSPTNTPIPTDTPSPTNTPIPTDTPSPTDGPTNTPSPTDGPTNTPRPTDPPGTPGPTDPPSTSLPTGTPEQGTPGTPTPQGTTVPTSMPSATPTAPPPAVNADPQLSKRVDKTTAGIGDVVTYSIVIVNRGSTNATDVVVRDPLPAFLTYLSAGSTRGSPSYASGVVALSLGDLRPDEEVVLTIQARINSMPNPMINVAALTTSSETDNPVNNEDRISILTVADPPTRVPPAARVVPTPEPRFPNTSGSAMEIPSPWIVGAAGVLVAALSFVGIVLARRAGRARYSR